jgi:hypothetical protein
MPGAPNSFQEPNRESPEPNLQSGSFITFITFRLPLPDLIDENLETQASLDEQLSELCKFIRLDDEAQALKPLSRWA